MKDMKEMKVSDRFELPVFYESDPLSETAKFSGWHGGGLICKSLFLAFDDGDADLICLAINNYDRLQQENAELREFVLSLQLDVSSEIKLEELLAKLNKTEKHNG